MLTNSSLVFFVDLYMFIAYYSAASNVVHYLHIRRVIMTLLFRVFLISLFSVDFLQHFFLSVRWCRRGRSSLESLEKEKKRSQTNADGRNSNHSLVIKQAKLTRMMRHTMSIVFCD